MSRRSDRQLLIDNAEIHNYYRERLINLALSQFEWDGLPDTCDRRYFETMLLWHGKAAMYVPDGLEEWLSTNFLNAGNGFDVYGYPLDIYGVTFNGQTLPTHKWHILYDNQTKTSLLPKIDLYAKLLWEVHQTLRSNLQQQVTPYIITTSRNEALSFKNIFNRILGFQPVVEVKNNFNPDAIKTLDLKVPFYGNDIMELLKRIWAEALAVLGITAENQKKERVGSFENFDNRMEKVMSLNSRLLNRTEFCEKMNKDFGLNLSVNVSEAPTAFQPYEGGVEEWQSTP